MTSKKTILMIIPSLGRGGAERIFYLMSRELSKNFNVVQCFFNLNDQAYPVTSKEYYVLNPEPARTVIEKIINLYNRVKKLREIKRKIKPDFSISQMDGADYINIFTKVKSEKVISCIQCTLINDVSIKGIPGWIRKHFFIRFFYRWADAIVTVSDELQMEMKQFCKIPAFKVKTIYNFADIDEVTSSAKDSIDGELADVLSREFSLVTSGRLEEQKNQRFLLDIFHSFLQRGNKSKLFILGDGQLRNELVKHAMSLNLKVYSAWSNGPTKGDYDVYFMGFQKNPFKYFAKAKWFVFTSRWEGLPLVLVESMACKTPIVSTDCKTGPREILSKRIEPIKISEAPLMAEYGILMPDVDESAPADHLTLWVDTLMQLNADLSLREKYVDRQEERLRLFSLHFAIDAWKDLFEKLRR